MWHRSEKCHHSFVSFYFQSQNILDLLDVGPAPVNHPTTNGERPSTGGATDLLGLLGDVASISNPGTGC